MSDGTTDIPNPEQGGSVLASMSNAMVSLHKGQFGRGPTHARSGFATDDVLVCVLENALLPAELTLAEQGEVIRVQEARMFFQHATREKFIEAAEEIVGRRVRAFSSAMDPTSQMVFEIFVFEPR